MFTAGYGPIDGPPTDTRDFDTRDEAQAWLDSITPTLPPPTYIEHPAEGDTPAWTEQVCSWQAWIQAN